MIPNYILLDSARMLSEMETAKELNPHHLCLYSGKGGELLHQVAPYIFDYVPDSPFAEWFEEQGWGDAWGVRVGAAASLEVLHNHFRRFLITQTEAGEKVYFRFYDPRVLRIFLPACDTEQLQEFFGPAKYFIVEAENPSHALRFSLESGALRTEIKHLAGS